MEGETRTIRANTLESIEQTCFRDGWYMTDPNGKNNPAITKDVILAAREIQPYVPCEMELFPSPDGSVQWEDDDHTLEVYADRYKFDDQEVSFPEAIKKLKSLDYSQSDIKLELTIPKRFRRHFQTDRFVDSLCRMATDLAGVCKDPRMITLSGACEIDLMETIRKAFEHARVQK